ncbi:hypothetical protein GGS23DRAFT_123254 [Durotheca rogersii]|uniref:uncharacterized protein n=1 Tax=Durotheca rogersii TaxID=419775 RepID=UPI00221E795B|nr:uncharacterized protein GGS23DRAFT_123254 [Durotheca rogersii]KAI5862024.1 hypothetical protein GGS23DRAFT_123254 [Durotheca rogersii]
MDKQLDACFDRVEKALGVLVDSIAKYHPSVAQVNDLGLADIELNKGLEELQTHQSNYRRIQDLRAATTSLDGQIKDTLRLLANTRRELVGASATSFPEDHPSYDIRYDELLSYARRISKTTMPPAGAFNAISNASSSGPGVEVKAESGAETTATTPAVATPNANGASTPAAANGVPSQPTPVDLGTSQQTIGITTTTAVISDATATATNTTLPEPLQTHLNPHAHLSFVPWPSEEQVRKGAIASLAYMLEQGVELEGYDPEAEKKARREAEEEQQEEEERLRREREENARQQQQHQAQQQAQAQARMRAEREQQAQSQQAAAQQQSQAWRRASVTIGGGAGPSGSPSTSPVAEKRQFQFMGDDDDDDDD